MSFLLPVLISLTGLYLLIRLRAFFLLHPKTVFKTVLLGMKNKNTRRALTLALAGTLGVGNIFGVCAALAVGGAGSIFWLLVSSLFSMVIKYSESLLSFDSRLDRRGGMHRVIERCDMTKTKLKAPLYATLCLILAFLMGGALQSAAVFDTASGAFEDYRYFVFAIFIVLAIVGCRAGVEKIEKITATVIPVTSLIYISMLLCVLFRNYANIHHAVNLIFSSAFSGDALLGGALGSVTSRAVREGFSRGILSNEAGIGTSAMSHSRGGCTSAFDCGVFGIFEVFFDTVVLCPLTALAVLSCGASLKSDSPMSLISEALSSTLGDLSVIPLLLSIFAFAYATVICWFYYGGECFSYLTEGRWGRVYPPVFFLFCAVGCVMRRSLLLFLTDNIIFFMALLTLSVILRSRERIVKITETALGKNNKERPRPPRKNI